MIFINEISLALKELIEQSVTCYKHGELITPKLFTNVDDLDDEELSKNILLFATIPQKEFTEEQTPAIMFRVYDIKDSFARFDNTKAYEIDVGSKGHEITKGEPIDLYFQIDFFSDFYYQIAEMESSWRQNVKRSHALVIPNVGTTTMTRVDYQVLDKANGERFFRRTFSYKIWGRMDDDIKEVDIATSVGVNLKIMESLGR